MARNESQRLFQDFTTQQLSEEESEQGMIVLYTTSVTGVRNTFSACESIKRIFNMLRLKVRIRDVAMEQEYAAELARRLSPEAIVPQVFVSGAHLGDATTISGLHETGKLAQMLINFEERPDKNCQRCGGAGFYICTWCQGSKKSTENTWAQEHERMPKILSTIGVVKTRPADPMNIDGRGVGAALRCTACNALALQRCESC